MGAVDNTDGLKNAKPKISEDAETAPSNIEEEIKKRDILLPEVPPSHSEHLEFRRFKVERKNERLERTLRKENAAKAFSFTRCWTVFIGVLILLKGFGKHIQFTLTTVEFLGVIGSLTASIFTFYILVLKYLFYRKDKNDKKSP